jgi:hypothetical protein
MVRRHTVEQRQAPHFPRTCSPRIDSMQRVLDFVKLAYQMALPCAAFA